MKKIVCTITFGFSLGIVTCYFLSNINNDFSIHNENESAQQKNMSADSHILLGNVQKNVDDENKILLIPSPLPEESAENGDFQDV